MKENSITGKLIDSEGNPLRSLTVQLSSNKKTVITDTEGNFSILINRNGLDTLLISGVGYNQFIVTINTKNGEALSLGGIIVSRVFSNLPGVEITGREKQSYKSDYSFSGTKLHTAQKDIPQSISTITHELTNDKMKFHLNEAVSDAAGINLYSGNDEYTIRGFKAENAHLINGLRTFNSALVSPLLVNIDRIEVIKGPTSVLYGNADPGGNINLVTKKPLKKYFAKAGIWYGSFQSMHAEADVTGPATESGKWLYRLNAGVEDNGSFRNGLKKNSMALAPSISFIPNDKLELNFDFSVQHTNSMVDRGQPGVLNNSKLMSTPIHLSVIQPGDYLKETDASAIISLAKKINNQISFNSAALIYNTSQKLKEHSINGYITPDSVYLNYMDRNYQAFVATWSNYATFKFSSGKFNHQLMAGYDFAASAVTIEKFNGELSNIFGKRSGTVGTFSLLRPAYYGRNVNNYSASSKQNTDPVSEEYITHGLFLQEQVSVGNWQFLLGLRDSYYMGDEEDSASVPAENVILPRLAVVLKLNQNLNLFATYNKGYDPFEKSQVLQVFKEPFKPLYSELLEAGAKSDLLGNRISLSMALYRLRVNNIAVNANDPLNADLFIQRGMDQSVGLETEASGNLTPNLSLSVSYAWNRAIIKRSSNQAEINMLKENAPIFAGSSWFRYSTTKGFFKGLNFSVGHTHQTKRNTLIPGLVLPGFAVFQSGIGYNYKNAKVGFNVNNIFNSTYWVGGYNYASKWPGSPRNVMVCFEYVFK